MTELYQFFNSSESQLRTYNAEDFSLMFSTFIQTGLIHIDNETFLEVSVDSQPLNVVLSKGAAIIDGHLYKNLDDYTLTVNPTDTERIDRLVIRMDNTDESKHTKAFIIEGEEAVAPVLTRNEEVYEISLAQLHIKSDGSITLLDERFDKALCGLASSLFSIPLEDLKENFAIFKDQLNTDFNNFMNSLSEAIDTTDIRNELDLIKRNHADVLMQRYDEGLSNVGERGYYFDTLSDNLKLNMNDTTCTIDTDKQQISLPQGSLTGEIEWKVNPIGFVTNKVTHYHKRSVGQLLEVTQVAYGGSNTITVQNVEITLTEVN